MQPILKMFIGLNSLHILNSENLNSIVRDASEKYKAMK